jgi:hypothetical protein
MQRYDAKRRQAIAVIESLRAGIPTRTSTRELPDLRASLTDLIRQDLTAFAEGDPDGNGSAARPLGRLAWGPYGQGKTHALTTVEHVALDLGFAVSRVSLSREVSCHHLYNFYGRVASAIRTPDSKMSGIAGALSKRKAGDLEDSPLTEEGRYVHPLPALILEDYFYTAGEEQDLLYGDLMGTRLSSPEFKRIHRSARGEALPRFDINFRTTQHGSAYFGMMADAITLCGYKGWVLLLDEVELVGRLGKVGRLQAYRNLNWLLNWSDCSTVPHGGNRPFLTDLEPGEELFCRNPYPIYTLGVVASSLRNDVWFSGTNTLSAKKDTVLIPELAKEKFGDRGAAELRNFFEAALGAQCPVIRPVETATLLQLLNKLVELHGTAYGWKAHLDTKQLVQTIGSQPVRTHIRATLEALDIAYVYHEDVKLRATDLMEIPMTEDEAFFAEDAPEG